MKINLKVSGPIEYEPGVYKTAVTHPLLEGELFFIHGAKNRNQTLMALQNSLSDDINEIVTMVKDLRG